RRRWSTTVIVSACASSGSTRWFLPATSRSGSARCSTGTRRTTPCGSSGSRWTERCSAATDDLSPHDRVDAPKRLPRGGRDRLPPGGVGAPAEVIERARAGPGRLADDDAADHPRLLVRHTVVVVDAFDGQCHVEMGAFLNEKSGVPRRGRLGNAQRVPIVLRMVRGRRVHIALDDPPHGRPPLHPHADGVEPDALAPLRRAHVDLDERRGARAAAHAETHDRERAAGHERAPRGQRYCFSAADLSGVTYHTTTW